VPPAIAASSSKAPLSGIAKAAGLLVALGPKASAKVLTQLKESEIEALTVQVAKLDRLTEQELDAVVDECHQISLAQRFISTGGVEYAGEMLTLALGPERARMLIDRCVITRPPAPFEFLRKSDPKQMAVFLQNEHPQTIALILSHLSSAQAAAVLTNLGDNLQADVAKRIANMDRTPPEIVQRVEDVMRRRMSSLISQDALRVGGTPYLVQVLTSVDRGTEKHILDRLTETDPALADEVRKMMFTFDDLIALDDRSIQRVLRDIDSKDLALALKAAREDLREHIFNNMSTRAASMLREEIDFLGPVRIRNVEEAQQRIVTVVRRLEEAEEIVISRGGEDQLLG
jgi:flagellar motor switch protein FliG